MKTRLLLVFLVLLFASCSTKEKAPDAEKPESSETAAAAEATVASESLATAETPAEAEASAEAEAVVVTAAARLKEIQKEYLTARNDFMVAYRAADSDEEKKKLFEEKYPKPETYSDQIMAIVNQGVESETEFDALTWIATNVRSNGTGLDETAKERLFRDHIENEGMLGICQGMIYSRGKKNQERLELVIEKTPHHDVKGWATFALASYLSRLPGEKSEEDEKRIEDLFVSVSTDFADITTRRGTLGELAEASLFEARNLAVGKVVPDIEGVDLDGVEFKLSDYRGKVVMLDFWGDW